MKILLFEKSVHISRQIERNIKSIDMSIEIVKAALIQDAIEHATISDFDIVIADGDNMNGSYKKLVELVKVQNRNSYLILLFSFIAQRITDYFIRTGTDFCFDKLQGFDSFMLIIKSIHGECTFDKAY